MGWEGLGGDGGTYDYGDVPCLDGGVGVFCCVGEDFFADLPLSDLVLERCAMDLPPSLWIVAWTLGWASAVKISIRVEIC